MDDAPDSFTHPGARADELLRSHRSGQTGRAAGGDPASMTERALASSLHRLQFLSAISEELALIEQDYPGVMDTITRRLAEQVGDLCLVRLLTPDRAELAPGVCHHLNPQAAAAARLVVGGETVPSDEPFYRQVLESREALLVPVISPEEGLTLFSPASHSYIEQFGISSMLVVPIRIHGEVHGIITLARDRAGQPYNREDQSLAQDIADRAALAILNSRLYAANLARQQELEHTIAQRTAEIRIMNQRLMQELSERGKIEAELRKSEAHYRLMAENASDLIWTMDFNLNLTHVSPSVERVLGYSQVTGSIAQLEYLFSPASYTTIMRMITQEMLPGCLESWKQNPYRTLTIDLEHIHKEGHSVWLEVKVSLLRDERGEVTGLLGVARDITERREANERLRYLATHDPLTHLPTRTLFMDRLAQAIERAQRSHKSVAVLMLDMDNFKKVNDTLGHALGDLALQTSAQRMKACMRKVDTIARFGGDEFNFVLEDVESQEFCAGVAMRLLAALNEPLELDSAQFRLGASVGIAFYPQDADNAEDLLWCADKAMYAAKKKRSDYAFYTKK